MTAGVVALDASCVPSGDQDDRARARRAGRDHGACARPRREIDVLDTAGSPHSRRARPPSGNALIPWTGPSIVASTRASRPQSAARPEGDRATGRRRPRGPRRAARRDRAATAASASADDPEARAATRQRARVRARRRPRPSAPRASSRAARPSGVVAPATRAVHADSDRRAALGQRRFLAASIVGPESTLSPVGRRPEDNLVNDDAQRPDVRSQLARSPRAISGAM